MTKIKVTLERSALHRIPEHRKIVKALGLGRVHSTSILPNNASIRGAIDKVAYLVSIEEVNE
ncbi:50S ribosomal protein L30 [Xylocopilactobacillus apis]|uniref:Large ribosomal subunit protein uL30 n=1 Tax=Xylocopilactobacillus apis TaxID=2932183 RepID=A0AAU9D128_9LACO|nr:50S ribosomal protein L30 [Xylocopilactobacillus apis]BDR57253.1 50S ribosomal protein L30 [Xylocopilactobacillus apis]